MEFLSMSGTEWLVSLGVITLSAASGDGGGSIISCVHEEIVAYLEMLPELFNGCFVSGNLKNSKENKSIFL